MEERLAREDMWHLIKLARREKEAVDNPEWIMAYDNFIFACSVLDAFYARSSVPSYMVGRPLEIGTEAGIPPVDSCGPNCPCTATTNNL